MGFKLGKYKVQQGKFQLMEISFVLFVLASAAIAAVLGSYVYRQIGTQLNQSSLQTPESAAAYEKMDRAWYIVDNAIVFVTIGLTLGLIVTSFLIPTHPVFVLINIVGFMILVFIGAVYSNTYFDIANSSPEMLNATLTYYHSTTTIMTYLPYLAAMLVFLCSVVMYTKGKQY